MATSTTKACPYKPLDLGGKAIRVLKLFSSDDRNSEIRCQIEHVDLDTKPVYEALSYTWGDANDRREIQIDGIQVSVTANLETALHYLRQTPDIKPHRTLWDDAVCINQGDHAEKACQIRMMYEIYASAAAVIAWTGEASESDNVAEAFRAAIALKDAINLCWTRLNLRPSSENMNMPSARALLQVAKFRPLEYNWDSLWRFLQRPYFTRVWVVQELYAATEAEEERGNSGAHICCGVMVLRAKVLRTVALWLTMITPNLVGPLSLLTVTDVGGMAQFNRIANIVHSFDRYRQMDGTFVSGITMMVASIPLVMEKNPQITTLSMASTFAATELRDKVYALLGLLGDEYKDFPIDYRDDIETVYQTLTYTIIAHHNNLRVLNGNRSQPSWKRIQASWTMDPYQVSIGLPDGFPEEKLYRTGGTEPIVTAWDKQAKTLTVRGLILTRLATVQGPFGHGLRSVLPQVKTIFSKLRADPVAFEKAWKTAVRVNGGLASDLFKVVDYFADEIPGCITVASHLWRPITSPVLEAFYTRLSGGSSDTTIKADDGMIMEELATMFEADTDVGKPKVRGFLDRLAKSLADRCFCVAESGGYYILGPYGSQPGDVVAVFVGEKKPYVLRERGGGRFELVGDAFVSGIMAGELFGGGNEEEIAIEMVVLV